MRSVVAGGIRTLFLESEDGTEFKAQVQERELQRIDTRSSAPLYLTFAPQSAHLLNDGD